MACLTFTHPFASDDVAAERILIIPCPFLLLSHHIPLCTLPVCARSHHIRLCYIPTPEPSSLTHPINPRRQTR